MHTQQCLPIALFPNAGYAGVVIYCTVLQIIPTLTIYHFDPSKADTRRSRDASHKHCSDVVRCDIEQPGLDFDGVEEITKDN